jgi:Amt family ammonium transporter
MSHFVQTAGSIQAWDDENQVPIIYNNGDIAWTLASTALVWIMIPGVGFFYSGLLRRKNALSMIYLSMMTVAVVSFQVRSRRSPNPYITR